MTHRDPFSACHPLVQLLYFGLVLGFAMFLWHPLCLAVSLGGALAYGVVLKGKKALPFFLRVLLPLMALAALLNPAFSHEGVTILAYLPSGNPLTLESIAYGGAAAGMLGSVVCWFYCVTEVMTTDRLVYLFGRILPALSLVLSMTLRFLPRCKQRLGEIALAQRCIGRDPSRGTIPQRARKGLSLLSVLVTWSMESAVATADSMRSRGYGLPGRTAFALYRLDRRDKTLLLLLALAGGFLTAGTLRGGFAWHYYPLLQGVRSGVLFGSLTGGYLLLCLLPVLLSGREARRWKRLPSGI